MRLCWALLLSPLLMALVTATAVAQSTDVHVGLMVTNEPPFHGPEVVTGAVHVRLDVLSPRQNGSTASQAATDVGPIAVPSHCLPFDVLSVGGQPPVSLAFSREVLPASGDAVSSDHAAIGFVFGTDGEIRLRLSEWTDLATFVGCVLGDTAHVSMIWARPGSLDVLSGPASMVQKDSIRPGFLQPLLKPHAVGLVDGDGTMHEGWATNRMEIKGAAMEAAYGQEVAFSIAATSTSPTSISLTWILGTGAAVFAAWLWNTELLRRGAARLAVFGFSRVSRARILDHPTRQRILDFVNENPGAAFGQIRQGLSIGHGSLAHHLRALQREGVVRTRRDGTRCRVYARTLPLPALDLGHEGPLRRAALEMVRTNPGLTQRALAERLHVPRRTAAYHLQCLLRADAIVAQRRSRWLTYYAREERSG